MVCTRTSSHIERLNGRDVRGCVRFRISHRIEQIKPVRSPCECQGQRGNAEQTSRFAMSQTFACVSSNVNAICIVCLQVQKVRQNRAVLGGCLVSVALLTVQRGRVLQFGQATQFVENQCTIEKRGVVAIQCGISGVARIQLVRCVRNEQIGGLLAGRETSITTLSLGTCQRVLVVCR